MPSRFWKEVLSTPLNTQTPNQKNWKLIEMRFFYSQRLRIMWTKDWVDPYSFALIGRVGCSSESFVRSSLLLFTPLLLLLLQVHPVLLFCKLPFSSISIQSQFSFSFSSKVILIFCLQTKAFLNKIYIFKSLQKAKWIFFLTATFFICVLSISSTYPSESVGW